MCNNLFLYLWYEFSGTGTSTALLEKSSCEQCLYVVTARSSFQHLFSTYENWPTAKTCLNASLQANKVWTERIDDVGMVLTVSPFCVS